MGQAGDTTCSVPAVRDGCVYHVTRLAGGKPRCVGGSSGSVQANGCPASSCAEPGRRCCRLMMLLHRVNCFGRIRIYHRLYPRSPFKQKFYSEEGVNTTMESACSGIQMYVCVSVRLSVLGSSKGENSSSCVCVCAPLNIRVPPTPSIESQAPTTEGRAHRPPDTTHLHDPRRKRTTAATALAAVAAAAAARAITQCAHTHVSAQYTTHLPSPSLLPTPTIMLLHPPTPCRLLDASTPRRRRRTPRASQDWQLTSPPPRLPPHPPSSPPPPAE